MLFELLKNAMRAVVEAHRRGRSLPPVHVHICKAPSSVTLRISDQVRARGTPRGAQGREGFYPHRLDTIAAL